MKEYIDKDAARDLMEQALVDEWEIQYADDRLDEIPAADVVEVVRCKDCAKYDPDAEWCNVWQYYLQPDFFCACGKRRSDNG